MQRIFRDTWSWRGALALDELDYEPTLADATDGPIERPADGLWPWLTTASEVVTLLHREGAGGPEAGVGVATAQLLLQQRSGGYHALLPRRMPDVAARYAAVLEGGDAIGLEQALRAMEQVGAVELTERHVALVRPPAPDQEELAAARRRMDDAEQRPDLTPLTRRIQRLSWSVGQDGVAGRRFRELSRAGRLRATVLEPRPGFSDPEGVYQVGPLALPSLALAVSTDEAGRNSVRGWVSGHGLRYERPPGDGDPVDAAAFEVTTLLLGAGVGANAVRRAKRACALWLLLLEHTGGRIGAFDTSVAALAHELARLLNWDPEGDHRSTVTQLLGDLERAGLVSADRPARKVLRVRVHPVEAPADDDVQRFCRLWMGWRTTGPCDPTDDFPRLMDLVARHLRDRIRAGWVERLEARRLRVEVLPPIRRAA